MGRYIYNYILDVDKKLNDNNIDIDELISEHLIKIQFFQHERLIHLLVTLFYAFFMLIFLALSLIHIVFLIVFFIFVIFVLFYVVYYFKLENSIQYLYKQYDKMKSKVMK
ncbi:MAG: hypothetical protein IKO49_08150 [Bacilli bacterium]|nr:hypothetical protein [Bacilli bacterium]